MRGMTRGDDDDKTQDLGNHDQFESHPLDIFKRLWGRVLDPEVKIDCSNLFDLVLEMRVKLKDADEDESKPEEWVG